MNLKKISAVAGSVIGAGAGGVIGAGITFFSMRLCSSVDGAPPKVLASPEQCAAWQEQFQNLPASISTSQAHQQYNDNCLQDPDRNRLLCYGLVPPVDLTLLCLCVSLGGAIGGMSGYYIGRCLDHFCSFNAEKNIEAEFDELEEEEGEVSASPDSANNYFLP